MCTSASRNWPVGVCALKPERKEAPGPNQLPIEMLREVLSYLPPRTLLRHCRPVCRRWRDLVDAWYLWRSILPWTHPDLWPVIRTCLPPADDRGPCIQGRFSERRPIGCNLLWNPRVEGGEPSKGVLKDADGRVLRGVASWETYGTSPWAGGLVRNLVTNLFKKKTNFFYFVLGYSRLTIL